MNIEELIYALYKFYDVKNNRELAVKMNTTPQAISNWKSRNSINGIKKKCMELEIYDDIFKDNIFLQTGSNLNIDSEELRLMEALSATAKALNKQDELKKELTALLSKLATLKD